MVNDSKKSTSVDVCPSDPRHYCTCCNRKLVNHRLKRIRYPLLKRSGWVCHKCFDAYSGLMGYVTDNDN